MKWVARERPKIDRIACPWLIARFIDRQPEFLYVPADQVLRVAEETGAVAYHVPGVEMGHVGELCSFDTFLKKHQLSDPALQRLASIARRRHLAPGPDAAVRRAVCDLDRPVAQLRRRPRDAEARHGDVRRAVRPVPDQSSVAKETEMTTPPAFTSQEAPKPLPFDPARLNGLSQKLIQSHWENNYGGAVKALANVKTRLAQASADKDLPPYVYNDLKREHLIRTGSVVLHELYFENLGGSGQAGAVERQAIAQAFGSFEAWEAEFRRIGAGLGGGSGWVVLGFNQHTRQLENYWMADHAHGPATTLPILVMDMYEHSYQMDFGAAAGKYIDAFFQNIQWDAVGARLAASNR
jgi:Fe-Mn family superoxide dismutase